MTVSQLNRHIIDTIAPKVGDREAVAMTRVMFEHLLGYQPVDIILHAGRELEDFTVDRFNAVARRIVDGEPLQYILGVARFMGNDYEVNRSTLIPRPETAELVDMIVDRHGSQPDLRLLDIGTGSGCIAIALVRALKFPQITAVDISDEALETARRNAKRLAPGRVKFVKADALDAKTMPHETFDVIVSNPPYIAEHEAAHMEAHVLDHEPHSALFVPDDDPLRFYTAIAHYAKTSLAPGGMLYFEINPLYAANLETQLNGMGFCDTTLTRDYLGRLRYLSCTMQQN